MSLVVGESGVLLANQRLIFLNAKSWRRRLGVRQVALIRTNIALPRCATFATVLLRIVYCASGVIMGRRRDFSQPRLAARGARAGAPASVQLRVGPHSRAAHPRAVDQVAFGTDNDHDQHHRCGFY